MTEEVGAVIAVLVGLVVLVFSDHIAAALVRWNERSRYKPLLAPGRGMVRVIVLAAGAAAIVMGMLELL